MIKHFIVGQFQARADFSTHILMSPKTWSDANKCTQFRWDDDGHKNVWQKLYSYSSCCFYISTTLSYYDTCITYCILSDNFTWWNHFHKGASWKILLDSLPIIPIISISSLFAPSSCNIHLFSPPPSSLSPYLTRQSLCDRKNNPYLSFTLLYSSLCWNDAETDDQHKDPLIDMHKDHRDVQMF